MLCPFTFLQSFKKISETFFKLQKGATVITDNVQRAITPKAGKSQLQILSFANCIMVIYICIKFQENI